MLFFDKLYKTNSTVLVSLRNNHKLVCKLKKYDKHFNLIVYDVTVYKKMTSKNRGVKKRLEGYKSEEDLEDKEVYIRGDTIITISEL
ncbi:small nuclear ribonucleoprotein Sm D2 [Vairimorpha necatrix]|uniref:Small nuclear ribonucleoprotein Sm D2 n=1 Tax=Vairimorpha necatrix TaxID=6039 RepID=A0AAX4J9N1_9MICR